MLQHYNTFISFIDFCTSRPKNENCKLCQNDIKYAKVNAE